MGLKIRLARFGAKKRPYYQIVVSDSKSPRDGRFIEKIGVYNPMLPKDAEERVKLDGERATYWVKAGALPTDRVARFLAERGLYQWKHGANPSRAEPGKKMKERADKRRERDEAAKTASEAASAVSE